MTYEGEVEMPAGLKKPKATHGGGGVAPPVKKISVQDMIAKIRETFDISDEEALHIREVSEEKLEDESIRQTVVAHRTDVGFLESFIRTMSIQASRRPMLYGSCMSSLATRNIQTRVLSSTLWPIR